jgi:transcriptional regulator with XRE-family HTH domain
MAAAVEISPTLALSARLSQLRRSRGWTLARLAAATRLSRPYLSRLESGRRQPSLAALLALARAFDTPLHSLIEDEARPHASPAAITGGRAQVRRGNGLRYRVVSCGGRTSLNAVHIVVPRTRRPTGFVRHEGEELLYVLSGTLNLIFENHTYLLKPGDSAHFDSGLPHRLSAAGPTDVEALLVTHVPAAKSGEAIAAVAGSRHVPRGARARLKNKPAAMTDAVSICTALD